VKSSQTIQLDSPDAEAFDAFWHFIAERYAIWERRQQGIPWPWTDDPILQQYRFCNTYRRLDVGTIAVIEDILRWVGKAPDSLVLYNVFLYRAFNKPSTYRYLLRDADLLGHDSGKLIARLENYNSNTSMYGSAYILRGFEGEPKYVSIVRALEKAWDLRESLVASIEAENTLQNAVTTLVQAGIRGWGDFTCYQVALDLTYSPILESATDLDTWCAFGWGAMEGLRFLWPHITLQETMMLEASRYLLSLAPKYVPSHMPRLNLQDIEFNLCEMAKYVKIQRGQKARRRYSPPERGSI